MAHDFLQDLILAKLSENNWYNLFSLSGQCVFCFFLKSFAGKRSCDRKIK